MAVGGGGDKTYLELNSHNPPPSKTLTVLSSFVTVRIYFPAWAETILLMPLLSLASPSTPPPSPSSPASFISLSSSSFSPPSPPSSPLFRFFPATLPPFPLSPPSFLFPFFFFFTCRIAAGAVHFANDSPVRALKEWMCGPVQVYNVPVSGT